MLAYQYCSPLCTMLARAEGLGSIIMDTLFPQETSHGDGRVEDGFFQSSGSRLDQGDIDRCGCQALDMLPLLFG
ncbi:hypothetical protein D3C80_1223490 [compost metagenome]